MKFRIYALALTFVFLSGCAAMAPYDYSALEANPPRSILVLPPLNNSVEVNAPYVYLSTITRPLAEKGYYVFPVSVVDTFMKQNGLPTAAEMHQVSLEKLDEVFGADAVLYVEIQDWGQKYSILSSSTIVSSRARLVDIKTGTTLWDGSAAQVQSSGDGGGGLAGALIGAIATQIVASSTDHTQGLSSTANATMVNSAHSGLLPGPYRPVEQK